MSLDECATSMTDDLGMEKHRGRGLDVSWSDTAVPRKKPSRLRWMHPEQQQLL